MIVQFLNKRMKMKVKNIRPCKEKLDILKQHLRITKESLLKTKLKKNQKIFKKAIMMKINRGIVLLLQMCIIRMTLRK